MLSKACASVVLFIVSGCECSSFRCNGCSSFQHCTISSDSLDVSRSAARTILRRVKIDGEFISQASIRSLKMDIESLLALKDEDISDINDYACAVIVSGVSEDSDVLNVVELRFETIASKRMKLLWAIALFEKGHRLPNAIRLLMSSLDDKIVKALGSKFRLEVRSEFEVLEKRLKIE